MHSYGFISQRQRDIIQRRVTGRTVTDLGAYCLEHSHTLLWLGASSVIAVDKGIMPDKHDMRIKKVRSYFHDYTAPISLAFVSWPINNDDKGLLALVQRAKQVIVLSKNTDGTACGFPGLYRHLTTRALLHYEPDPKNCLIVVGGKLLKPRKPTGEERAGMSWTTLTTYEKSEGLPPRPDFERPADLFERFLEERRPRPD